MGRVDRPWLRRIPGYRERRLWRPGEGATPRAREDDEGDPALKDSGAGEPGEKEDSDATTPGEGERGEEQAAAPPEGSDEPGAGEPGDADGAAAGEPGAIPPDLDTALSLPDDLEQARKEAEEKKRRTPWNRFHAPRAFPLEGRYLRGLATRFARMVSKLAEDNADLPADGDDEWDLNALVRRRFTGKLPNQCRMSREKRKVVVVLDTSPSCAHQARLFGSIAQIAEELGDCELFDAPNFGLVARWQDGAWQDLPPAERDWPFQQRVVLAFGDFDGLDHICDASKRRGNRIFWFCCEERATVLESGRDTFVHDYKGKYFPATQVTQLMRAMGKVR